MASKIFLLSPARTDGKRALLLMNPAAQFDLARKIQSAKGAELSTVFAFLSGLYFRGKVAYSRRFGRAPRGAASHYVITSNAGLLRPSTRISLSRLAAFAQVPIELGERRYIDPLRESVAALKRSIPETCEIILLGSIATGKYCDVLLAEFGARLLFPVDFIGRGDMSRGGLMLRAAASGNELPYIPVINAETRRGARPPKLPPPT